MQALNASRMTPSGYIDVRRAEFMATIAPSFTPDQMEFIEAAYFLSKNAHRPQTRDDGTRYFEHPKTVAWLIAVHFGIHDYRTICIALLHDMLEDSFIMTPRFIRRTFNQKIMMGCKIMSKNDFDKTVVGDVDAAYYARFVSADASWRELVVKLADRIHNVFTMDHMDLDRVERKLDETDRLFPALQERLLSIVPAKHYEAVQNLCATFDVVVAERRLWLEQERSMAS